MDTLIQLLGAPAHEATQLKQQLESSGDGIGFKKFWPWCVRLLDSESGQRAWSLTCVGDRYTRNMLRLSTRGSTSKASRNSPQRVDLSETDDDVIGVPEIAYLVSRVYTTLLKFV